MEKKEIGLIVLFIAVIVGFVAVFQVYDGNQSEVDNGDSPDNGSSMDNTGQFDSLHFSQTTTTENMDSELKMEIWYRKTSSGIDYKQVQTIGENTQVQIYNSEEENMYQGIEEGQWIYQELPYENFEPGIEQTLAYFDGIVTEYTEGDTYSDPQQGNEWTIQSLEKNGEMKDDLFTPPEDAMVVSQDEIQQQQEQQQQ